MNHDIPQQSPISFGPRTSQLQGLAARRGLTRGIRPGHRRGEAQQCGASEAQHGGETRWQGDAKICGKWELVVELPKKSPS